MHVGAMFAQWFACDLARAMVFVRRIGGCVHAMVFCVRDGIFVQCCGGVRATMHYGAYLICLSAVVHERRWAYNEL